MYNELIQKDIDALEREESDDIGKHNILDILNNVGSIFIGACLHFKDAPKKTMSERSIAERTKLRRGRFDEIKRKELDINNELFKAYFTDYQSPSDMYKKLSKTKDAVNEFRVYSIKKVLINLKRIIEHTPKDDAAKIEEDEKRIDIVERVLELDNKIQSGQGLKILTSSLLNAGNNSEKLKNEITQLFSGANPEIFKRGGGGGRTMSATMVGGRRKF